MTRAASSAPGVGFGRGLQRDDALAIAEQIDVGTPGQSGHALPTPDRALVAQEPTFSGSVTHDLQLELELVRVGSPPRFRPQQSKFKLKQAAGEGSPSLTVRSVQRSSHGRR